MDWLPGILTHECHAPTLALRRFTISARRPQSAAVRARFTVSLHLSSPSHSAIFDPSVKSGSEGNNHG